jgi:hypothetical protein
MKVPKKRDPALGTTLSFLKWVSVSIGAWLKFVQLLETLMGFNLHGAEVTCVLFYHTREKAKGMLQLPINSYLRFDNV